MLGKYLVTSLEGDEEGGLGWHTPRFPVLLQPFFPPSFSHFSGGRASSQEGDTGLSYPPAARVGEASCCPPLEGVGRF